MIIVGFLSKTIGSSFFFTANNEVISSISILGSFIEFQTKSGLFGSVSGNNKSLVHCRGLTLTFNFIFGFVGWGALAKPKTGTPGGPGGVGTPGGGGTPGGDGTPGGGGTPGGDGTPGGGGGGGGGGGTGPPDVFCSDWGGRFGDDWDSFSSSFLKLPLEIVSSNSFILDSKSWFCFFSSSFLYELFLIWLSKFLTFSSINFI